MLVITRTVEEEIRIGDVIVKVLSVRAKRVRLGISAPPNVKVIRTELIGRKPREGGRDIYTEEKS